MRRKAELINKISTFYFEISKTCAMDKGINDAKYAAGAKRLTQKKSAKRWCIYKSTINAD